MSTAQDYINHPDVLKALQTVKGECRSKQYSDIIDADDHQYVDLVMEGGGVLGIALTGYTYILEQAGFRFLGVGGTSARGAKAAAEFLCAFDWPKYKTIRKGLAEAFQASIGNGPAKELG